MNVETLQQAVRIGAHNVTEFPTSEKEFAEYIKTVYTSETTRLQALSDKSSLSGCPA
jgi:pilus assembly protein CpaE